MENWERFLEYFGVMTGLIYLVLEILQNRAMWVVGFITSFVYVFVFFLAKFYADMSLNVYYICISVYGFWQWRRIPAAETEGSPKILYCHLRPRLAFVLFCITMALYAGLFLVLSRGTDSPVPAGDAFTTAFSITATWMLARRILEHWWIWVVINLVSAWLYYGRGLYPTGFLFICYGILALVGWFNWKKKGKGYGQKK